MCFSRVLDRQVIQPVTQFGRQFEFFSFDRTPQFFFQPHFLLDYALGRIRVARRGPAAMACGERSCLSLRGCGRVLTSERSTGYGTETNEA